MDTPTRVTRITVPIHGAIGELAVWLHGVSREEVRIGQTLRGPID
jgi:hypothetical protein